MGFNFREAAKEATQLSQLMENREKITTEDIIAKFPDGITITQFDVITTDDATYPVFVFKENPDVFYCGGMILHKIVKQWLNAYNDNIEKCNSELSASGGVQVVLTATKTKKGNNVTSVKIL